MWNIPNEDCTHIIIVKQTDDEYWPCSHEDNESKICSEGDCPILSNDADVKLLRIARIIESVDNRCLAADGAVTKTLDEMTQAEISKIYKLAAQPSSEMDG